MTSIPAAISRIYRNNLKRIYLKNKILFLIFWLHFWNVHEILSIFKKKMSIVALLFPKLLMLKNVAT